MKKSIYLLAALSMVGANVFAKEVVAEPVEAVEAVIVQAKTVEPWKFAGRMYLEVEDFDNQSAVIGGNDDEDGTFIGTGISATRGKLTLDLNVEKRFGGDLSFINTDAEWDATRVDWKVRYQLFEKQAFHIKYRSENRTVDSERAPGWMQSTRRNRVELGTDFNHFNGLFAGWFVVGHDEDKNSSGANSDGNYWEGDFGPSFKITDRLSINPTLYTTGEFYDSEEMIETQLRVMMPYQLTDKVTIMPRVRVTLDRTVEDKSGNKIWEYKFADRIRYELMANVAINENFSSFMGVVYENADRTYAGGKKKDIDLFWSYVGVNYKFN